MKARYKFYREHKYVSFAVNDVERLIAKTDFQNLDEIKKTQSAFEVLCQMLAAHAAYENEKLHTLLKAKGSKVFEHAEEDHEQYDTLIEELRLRLDRILQENDAQTRIELGYQFYLHFRHFAGINLLHLHEEETQILPELQRLYTDEELKTVERDTYQKMTFEDIIHMLHVLFPHMNPSDKEAFLRDIQEARNF